MIIKILKVAPDEPFTREKEYKVRKTVINSFCDAIINIWSNAFGAEFIQPKKVVADKICTIIRSYYNEVSHNTHSSKSKR